MKEKLLVLYEKNRNRTMLTGYKMLTPCCLLEEDNESSSLEIDKPVKLRLLLIRFKSKILNAEDMKSFVFMLVWTKKKLYLNLQQY